MIRSHHSWHTTLVKKNLAFFKAEVYHSNGKKSKFCSVKHGLQLNPSIGILAKVSNVQLMFPDYQDYYHGHEDSAHLQTAISQDIAVVRASCLNEYSPYTCLPVVQP